MNYISKDEIVFHIVGEPNREGMSEIQFEIANHTLSFLISEKQLEDKFYPHDKKSRDKYFSG